MALFSEKPKEMQPGILKHVTDHLWGATVYFGVC